MATREPESLLRRGAIEFLFEVLETRPRSFCSAPRANAFEIDGIVQCDEDCRSEALAWRHT